MKSFNLKKTAAVKDVMIHEKMLKEQREDMEMCVKAQGVDNKNINLSLPTKDKDNTVPFNVQLESSRKGEKEEKIIESKMEQKEADIKDRRVQIMPINEESQKYDTEKTKAYKKAEDKSKTDTEFWDKYVGMQIEDEKTSVDKNISEKASQLPNNPERFKGDEIKKQIMASLKDADAMIFHIYATAEKENRDVNEHEQQQLIDINSGKMRLISKIVEPVRRSLEYKTDPKIIQDKDGTFSVVEQDGKPCAKGYRGTRDAKIDFPEAEE